MAQVLGADNIPVPVVASTTSLTLAATNKGLPSAYQIGGQQYSNTSTLTLNTATTGAGGLDTGSLGAIPCYQMNFDINVDAEL